MIGGGGAYAGFQVVENNKLKITTEQILQMREEEGKMTFDDSETVISSSNMEGEFNSPEADLYLLDSRVQGKKTSGNAKILTDDTKIIINNFHITSDKENGIYNVFEQPQNPKEILKEYSATNIIVDGTNLKHNVFNIYNLQDNATITIKNCKFDINMATSNVMRLSNYKNAENVEILFDNVEWTYENVGYESSDIDYAGLILYQPASTDVALEGDTSKIKTWTFRFKNCTYNGEKVTDVNFGLPEQVMYMYNIGKTKEVTNPTDLGINVLFM